MSKFILWVLYAIFVIAAVVLRGEEPLFQSSGPYAAGKYIAWLMYFGFLGYSIYCSTKEYFFRTLPELLKFHWGRQVGIDLYLGLVMILFLIYLNEGSLLVMALWTLPVLIFANLATLLYVAMNYGSIIAHFI